MFDLVFCHITAIMEPPIRPICYLPCLAFSRRSITDLRALPNSDFPFASSLALR